VLIYKITFEIFFFSTEYINLLYSKLYYNDIKIYTYNKYILVKVYGKEKYLSAYEIYNIK